VGSESGFQVAFSRACQGSAEDVRRLVDEYGAYILKVVRSRLDDRLRAKFDSLDFVQMVWASFFSEPGGFARFDNPQRLFRYLAAMARNKVVNEERRRIGDSKRGDGSKRLHEEVGRDVTKLDENTPSQHAMASERLSLLQSIESQRDREAMRLRMQGMAFQEIAERLGLHERTVRRIVERFLRAPS
jgi:RNA polymerase sigma-70 factor (ECF subfamily)